MSRIRNVKRKTRPSFESLEHRSLLTTCSIANVGDVTLVEDAFEVHQNAVRQSLDVLANDIFPAGYGGEQILTSPQDYYRPEVGSVEIAADGKTLLFSTDPFYSGPAETNYRVDGLGLCSGRVEFEIVSPLVDDEFQLFPDSDTYTLDILANDSFDPKFGVEPVVTYVSLHHSGVEDKGHATISPNGLSVIYHRPDGFYGDVELNYFAGDTEFGASISIHIVDPLEDDYVRFIEQGTPVIVNVIEDDPFWDGYQGERKITAITDVPAGSSAEVMPDGESIRFAPGAGTGGDVHYVIDDRFETSLFAWSEQRVSDDGYTVDPDEEVELRLRSNDYVNSRGSSWDRIYATRITEVTQPSTGGHVQISEDGRSVNYTPPEGFSGFEYFSYLADDKFEAQVKVRVRAPSTQFSSGPLNGDRIRDVQQGAGLQELDVLANDFGGYNDSNYRGDRLITAVSDIESARVEIASDSKSVLFEPLDNSTSHRFWYVVDDRYRTYVNVHPLLVATPSFISLTSPDPITINVVDELVNLPPNHDGLGEITSIHLTGASDSASISPDGQSIQYTPGDAEQTWIRYVIDDRFDSYITLYPVSFLEDDFGWTFQEQTVSVDVLTNDFSNENYAPYEGPRQITSATSRSGNVDVSVVDSQVNLTPKQDVFGTEFIDYIVDGIFASSIQLAVNQVTAQDRINYPLDATDGIQLDVLQNDGLFTEYSGPLDVTDVISSSQAVIEIADDAKSISYTAVPGFRGVDQLRYIVDDKFSATVDVHVNPPTDALFPNLESFNDLKEIVLARGDGERSEYSQDLIDEVDRFSPIKSDGNQEDGVIYVATRNSIGVLEKHNDQFEALSWLAFEGEFANYHLSGDRLAVISVESEATEFIDPDRATNPANRSDRNLARLTVFDVSDPSVVNRIRSVELDGSYIDSSLVDGAIQFVIRNEGLDRRVAFRDCFATTTNFELCDVEQRTKDRIENQFAAVYQDLAPQYAIFDGGGRWTESGLAVLPTDFIDPRSKQTSYDELVSSIAVDIHDDTSDLYAANVLFASASSSIMPSEEAGAFYLFEPLPNRTVISKYRFDSEDAVTRLVASTEIVGRLSNHLTPFEQDGLLHFTRVTSGIVEYHLLQENAGILDVASLRADVFTLASGGWNLENGRMLIHSRSEEDVSQIQILDIREPTAIQVTQPLNVPLPSRTWIRDFNSSSNHYYHTDWLGPNHLAFISSEWLTTLGARIYTVIVTDISNPTEAATVYEEVFVGDSFDTRRQMRESLLREIPELSATDVEGLPVGPYEVPSVDGVRFESPYYGGTIRVHDSATSKIVQEFQFEPSATVPSFVDPFEPELHTLQGQMIDQAAAQFGVTPEEITLFNIERNSAGLDAQVLVAGAQVSLEIPIVESDIDGQIEGQVYLDSSGDGLFQEGMEVPIPGVTLVLSGNDWFGNQLPMQTTVTDFRGAYTFDVTNFGDYEITQLQPQGYVDGQETPDPNYSMSTENDVISRRIFHVSGPANLTSQHSRNNNFGEARFASTPRLPDNFSHSVYFTSTFPYALGPPSSTVYRLPVSEHGATLQLDGDAMFYVLDQAGEIVAMRDGSGFLATEGADLAAEVSWNLERHYRSVPNTSQNVTFVGTGKPEDYFVVFFAKPGASWIRDLGIKLLHPDAESSPTLELEDQRLILVGTAGDDVIDVIMGYDEHIVTLNDFTYVFDSSDVTEIHVGGARGDDRVTVDGLNDITDASMMDGRSKVRTPYYSVHTYSMEKTTIHGRGWESRIKLFGSQESDKFESQAQGISTLTTPNFEYVVSGFDRVDAYGRGGNDTAYLYGTEYRDTFAANDDHAWLQSFRSLSYAKGFERVNALGRGGEDEAFFYASETRNRFVSTPEYVMLTDETVKNVARGFTDIRFKGKGHNDAAYIYAPISIRSSYPAIIASVDRPDREETIDDFRELYFDAVLYKHW